MKLFMILLCFLYVVLILLAVASGEQRGRCQEAAAREGAEQPDMQGDVCLAIREGVPVVIPLWSPPEGR